MKLVASGTLTINPAFLQDIKEDNVHLRELLAATAAALSRRRFPRIRLRALAELLASLRDQVATHFSLEEFFGYFDDATEAAPRLTNRAFQLRSQHDELYLLISELANDAERLLHRQWTAYEVSLLTERFHEFYEQLQLHEEQENELIMQAFYDDIGVGD